MKSAKTLRSQVERLKQKIYDLENDNRFFRSRLTEERKINKNLRSKLGRGHKNAK